MTRIVGGVARGRALAVPPGGGTRPTADRTREGLFSALEALLAARSGRIRGVWEGVRFLDLYAGTGAVGLEAASRGAGAVLLVESAPRVAPVLRRNARQVGLDGVQVRAGKVELVVCAPADEPYDVVFADPPYATSDATLLAVLGKLGVRGWVRDGSLVVLERSSRDPAWTWPAGYAGFRSRRYGDSTLWYGRAAGSGGGIRTNGE